MGRRQIYRCVAGIILIAMLVVISGCANDNSGEASKRGDGTGISWDPEEYVFVAEDVSFPRDLGDIFRFTYDDGKIFFTSEVTDNESKENLHLNSSTTSLYSISIDGTGLTKLPAYSPFAVKSDDAGGRVSVQGLEADGSGNLWVIEDWTFYDFSLPADFDADTDNPWGYSEVSDTGCVVRKLDGTGAELLNMDLAGIGKRQEYFNLSAFAVDSSENLYIAVAQTEEPGTKIYVMNADTVLFELTTDSYIDRFIHLPDGTLAFADLSGSLQTIDIPSKGFGEKIIIPAAGSGWSNARFYTGGGEFDVLIDDGSSLYGFVPGDDEAVKLLSWIESSVINESLQDIIVLPDGRFFCVNAVWRTSAVLEPFILTRVLRAELPEKTVITLATYGLFQGFDNAVITFNRRSSEYRIEVKNYSEHGMTPDGAELTLLTTEILAGEVPDILGIQGMPYMNFVEKGLLADLYPFIDADPELGRGDFVQPAIRAAEVGGGLYQFFPSFYIDTLIGNKEIVGADMGWGLGEFEAVLDEHPNADIPIGWMTAQELLKRVITYNMDEYIDWETGTSNFDTPEFIGLLQLCGRLPVDDDQNTSREVALSSGRQILSWYPAFQLGSLHAERFDFGGDIIFKGYPSVPGNGSVINTWGSFAIAENSPHKDAAWSFLRMLLSEDWQLERRGIPGMPTNQAVFDYDVNSALDYDYSNWWMESDGVRITLTNEQVQADVEMILSLIDSSVSGIVHKSDEALLNLITEAAIDYFNGLNSAEEAAKVIQSKAATYIAERG